MTFKLSTLRQEIATALTTIEDLNVSAYRPAPMLQAPCAFVLLDKIDYGFTLPRLNQKGTFKIQLLIGLQKDMSESQAETDEYLSVSGTKSISQAIRDGVFTDVTHVHCESMDQYGGFEYDGVLYWGATFTVDYY